jgi:hypothetical protein
LGLLLYISNLSIAARLISLFPFEVYEALIGIQSGYSRVKSAVIELPIILLEFDKAVIKVGLIVVSKLVRLCSDLVSTLL